MAIAGGGLAGASAAAILADAGRRVTLFEREIAPRDKICGEFLSHEARSYLCRLGVNPATLGGHPIGQVRLVGGGGAACTRLPFEGMGLSRRVLDAALLDRAKAAGARLVRAVVRQVDAGGVVLDEARHDAGAVLLATGKHELRGMARGRGSRLVGFKTYFSLAPAQRRALDGTVEVLLLRDGYAGLQLVEGGRANLCMLVGAERVARLGDWPAILAELCAELPALRDRLAGSQPLLVRPITIARVPYGFLYRSAADAPDGLFRLGDQMAVIPSFSGDGMSIALHSAAAAAAAVLAGSDAQTYHRQMRADFAGQMRTATWLQAAGGGALGRAAIMAALKLWPALLGRVALWTRVPEHRLHAH